MKKNPQGKDNFKAVCRKYFRKEDIFKVPNVLCYMRILLLALFLCFYLIPISIVGNPKADIYLAAGVMAIAVYTDFLDGFIARKFNQASEMGKVLDPIADKLTQFTIALAIAIKFHQFPFIITLVVLIMVKESWMFVAAIVLARHNKTFGGAKWFGKLSTFLIYVILGVLLAFGPFILEAYPLDKDPVTAHLIMNGLSGFAIMLEVFAFVKYFMLSVRLLKGAGENEVKKETVKEETK